MKHTVDLEYLEDLDVAVMPVTELDEELTHVLADQGIPGAEAVARFARMAEGRRARALHRKGAYVWTPSLHVASGDEAPWVQVEYLPGPFSCRVQPIRSGTTGGVLEISYRADFFPEGGLRCTVCLQDDPATVILDRLLGEEPTGTVVVIEQDLGNDPTLRGLNIAFSLGNRSR